MRRCKCKCRCRCRYIYIQYATYVTTEEAQLTENRKHILRMARIPLLPRLIPQRINQSRPMVPLIKRHGNQALGRLLRTIPDPAIPVCDHRLRDPGHALLRGQSRMQQPETGYLSCLGREFIEAVDGGQDAGDGVGLFGDGWRGGGEGGCCVEGFEGVCHGASNGGCQLRFARLCAYVEGSVEGSVVCRRRNGCSLSSAMPNSANTGHVPILPDGACSAPGRRKLYTTRTRFSLSSTTTPPATTTSPSLALPPLLSNPLRAIASPFCTPKRAFRLH